MEKERPINEIIDETQAAIVNAINGSRLHPSIVMLILQNVTMQVQGAIQSMSAPAATEEVKMDG